jgi:hypothetical protein
MNETTINLRSRVAGLKIELIPGEMGVRSANGRTIPVKRQPVFITFRGGAATVERHVVASDNTKIDVWTALGAKDRAGAIAALKERAYHGTHWWVLEETTSQPGTRVPSAASA